MICPNCNYPNPDTSNFCAQCGHPLSAMAAGQQQHEQMRKQLEMQWRFEELKELTEKLDKEKPPYQELIPAANVAGWLFACALGCLMFVMITVTFFDVLNNIIALAFYVLLNFAFLVAITRPDTRRWMCYSSTGVPRYHRGVLIHYGMSILWLLSFFTVVGADGLSVFCILFLVGGINLFLHFSCIDGLTRRQRLWEEYGRPMVSLQENRR